MGAFRGKNAKVLTMIVAIAILVVAAYVAVSNRNEEKAMTEAQKQNIVFAEENLTGKRACTLKPNLHS